MTERVRNPRCGGKGEILATGTGVAEVGCACWVDGICGGRVDGGKRRDTWRAERGEGSSGASARRSPGAWLMGGMAMPTVKVPP